jgi:hypothetical protein
MPKAVVVELPPPDRAPGIRDGIRDRAQWSLTEITTGFGLVEPFEGAGAVFPYFTAIKLCEAGTTLTDETWEPVIDAGGGAPDEGFRTMPHGEPNPEWRERLLEWAEKTGESGRRGSDLSAVSATFAALPEDAVAGYLQQQIPLLFEGNPNGSLWLFKVDPRFPRRLALLRVLLALNTIPDFLDATNKDLPQIRTLQEHTLTSGIRCDALVAPLLLAIPPTAMGFTFARMPHALVFLFGHPTSILEPQPPTFASLYAPTLHDSQAGFHWKESDFYERVNPADVETLFQWWVTRLNVIYSFALDPTNFDDGHGRFDVKAQTVWFLTFERLLADALSIAAAPQSPALARVETAFDLLDKAESLLGYNRANSGQGFKRLLRRDEMVPRLDAIWNRRLPVQLRMRFSAHTRFLYDRVYDHVREHAYDFRATANGINVWSSSQGKLIEWQLDQFVPDLVRAVRNSAHGLMEVFNKAAEKDVVVAHDGEMPPELPSLAALIALAMVADAERLCARTWMD